MADWLQIHLDFRLDEKGRLHARSTMSGDCKLQPYEAKAALSAVCKGIAQLTDMRFDEEAFERNISLERPWYHRAFKHLWK